MTTRCAHGTTQNNALQAHLTMENFGIKREKQEEAGLDGLSGQTQKLLLEPPRKE
jgi:hypothetical protein